ncbi:hypothetical protein GQ53DRAFT_208330 [Thozetella sp. PMI_491]|nr:hypothetical protein GQ53DRAFT_208330 [Thozetella sp. PMI_491]
MRTLPFESFDVVGEGLTKHTAKEVPLGMDDCIRCNTCPLPGGPSSMQQLCFGRPASVGRSVGCVLNHLEGSCSQACYTEATWKLLIAACCVAEAPSIALVRCVEGVRPPTTSSQVASGSTLLLTIGPVPSTDHDAILSQSWPLEPNRCLRAPGPGRWISGRGAVALRRHG